MIVHMKKVTALKGKNLLKLDYFVELTFAVCNERFSGDDAEMFNTLFKVKSKQNSSLFLSFSAAAEHSINPMDTITVNIK